MLSQSNIFISTSFTWIYYPGRDRKKKYFFFINIFLYIDPLKQIPPWCPEVETDWEIEGRRRRDDDDSAGDGSDGSNKTICNQDVVKREAVRKVKQMIVKDLLLEPKYLGSRSINLSVDFGWGGGRWNYLVNRHPLPPQVVGRESWVRQSWDAFTSLTKYLVFCVEPDNYNQTISQTNTQNIVLDPLTQPRPPPHNSFLQNVVKVISNFGQRLQRFCFIFGNLILILTKS